MWHSGIVRAQQASREWAGLPIPQMSDEGGPLPPPAPDCSQLHHDIIGGTCNRMWARSFLGAICLLFTASWPVGRFGKVPSLVISLHLGHGEFVSISWVELSNYNGVLMPLARPCLLTNI